MYRIVDTEENCGHSGICFKNLFELCIYYGNTYKHKTLVSFTYRKLQALF